MTIRLRMYPSPEQFVSDGSESGIRRVIESWAKHLPAYDIQVVRVRDETYDIDIAHAGTHPGTTLVACHGLYWSAEYPVDKWELNANADVIAGIRHAKEVSVPSRWVAETFERDMRFTPHIIPHGIDWDDWQHSSPREGYVLWNKNRNFDVCDPYPVGVLATAYPNLQFVTTFPPHQFPGTNLHVMGVVSHIRMKELIQKAGVYLATTKETFGIGILEAMASGTPVLGFAHGGITDLIEHGQTGYLARPGDYSDLIRGLEFCRKYAKFLGANAREAARYWTWEKAVGLVADMIRKGLEEEPPNASIIIPSYMYGSEEKVGRAIRSAQSQDYPLLKNIVVVDDGSPDEGATERVVRGYMDDERVTYIRTDNQGVANARNTGIALVDTKYVCCLDADDAIEPQFIRACVEPLEKDRSLGIAYTKLHWIKPDGSEGISPWPGEYNYDKFLQKQNQVPTCCLFRRKMWERLGGYNQRYAPGGAGAEDAEFFLRAGAYGWGGKLATEGALFIYSWLSGHVTGSKDYQEPDWLAMHPWVKDGLHPFASMATPANGQSHLVRSYDNPTISVIIPVGPKHAHEFINCLDSLESQTFRKWEVIVVLDGALVEPRIEAAYPYVRWIRLDKTGGAGASRNEGARHARAPLIMFLDADDWLYPEALQKMFDAYEEEPAIIYSDYVGKAYIDESDLEPLRPRLLFYNAKTKEAVLRHQSSEFDCERAQQQPYKKNQYIWCLISSLVPKAWHDEIGGFDEAMPSWEDWDYWIRMARVGRCFVRLPEPLVVYRFYTGERRDIGLQKYQSLLQYLTNKREGVDFVPCACRGKKRRIAEPTAQITARGAAMEKIMDKDIVLVKYQSLNTGQHHVIGPATKTSYGYRAGGETFYVHTRDIAQAPHLFTPVVDETVMAPVEEELPPPAGADEEPGEDLTLIPGITPEIAKKLNSKGVTTEQGLIDFGKDNLAAMRNVGKNRANIIFAYLERDRT